MGEWAPAFGGMPGKGGAGCGWGEYFGFRFQVSGFSCQLSVVSLEWPRLFGHRRCAATACRASWTAGCPLWGHGPCRRDAGSGLFDRRSSSVATPEGVACSGGAFTDCLCGSASLREWLFRRQRFFAIFARLRPGVHPLRIEAEIARCRRNRQGAHDTTRPFPSPLRNRTVRAAGPGGRSCDGWGRGGRGRRDGRGWDRPWAFIRFGVDDRSFFLISIRG